MGLTKQYLRYRCSGICNIVGSGRGGAAFLGKDTAAVASVSDVTVWDLRKKERLGTLVVDTKKKVEVTVISPSPSDTRMLAVGYSDGSIRCALLFSFQSFVTPLSQIMGCWHKGGGCDLHRTQD